MAKPPHFDRTTSDFDRPVAHYTSPSFRMTPPDQHPKDRRSRKIRKKIRKVGQDLTALNAFLEGLPGEIKTDVQKQLQKAFEAGCTYSEIRNVPNNLPVSKNGMLQIGSALRYHIMETRKVYGDIDQLREIVTDIFDKKSQQMLRRIMREEKTEVVQD